MGRRRWRVEGWGRETGIGVFAGGIMLWKLMFVGQGSRVV